MTQDTLKDFEHIPLEKFEFVNQGERISDQKFEDKPIGYFKDAWIRFRKNKGSIVASIIIIIIAIYEKKSEETAVSPDFLYYKSAC